MGLLRNAGVLSEVLECLSFLTSIYFVIFLLYSGSALVAVRILVQIELNGCIPVLSGSTWKPFQEVWIITNLQFFPCRPQVKPLGVIWGKFPQYSQRNTIMFDDLRRNFLMNPQSGLRIRPFREVSCSSILYLVASDVKISDLMTSGSRQQLMQSGVVDPNSLDPDPSLRAQDPPLQGGERPL